MYQAKVDAINKLEPSMQSLSDDQLRDKTKELQQRIAGGASLDDVLVEAFAVSATLSALWHIPEDLFCSAAEETWCTMSHAWALQVENCRP